MTLYGIDVSHHNAVLSYSLTGRSFLAARASIGTAPDELFVEHIGRAHAKNLVTIAYHFNWSEISVASQVDAFIEASGAKTGFVDKFALDVESDKVRDAHGTVIRIVPKFTRAQAREFINRFEDKTGEGCGLYMSASGFYYDVGAAWLWIASWGTARPAKADIWQYRGSPLDLDRFEGTREELLNLGTPVAPPSDVETELPIIVGSGGRVLGDLAANTPYFDAPDGKQIGTTSGTFEWIGSPTLADGSTRDPDWCLIVGLTADLQRVGGVARYVKRAALLNPRGWPDDCAPAVKAATDPLKAQLAAEMARANAAEAAVGRVKVAVGCDPTK